MNGRPAPVPELVVTDRAASLAFWCGPCGFRVLYDRPEEGFACIERGGSRVMLDEYSKGRPQRWEVAPTDRPFGRHINLEIAADDLGPVLAALEAARWPLFTVPETKTCRVREERLTVRQFLVRDPDGHLLRFSQELDGRGAGQAPQGSGTAAPSPPAAVRRAAPGTNRTRPAPARR